MSVAPVFLGSICTRVLLDPFVLDYDPKARIEKANSQRQGFEQLFEEGLQSEESIVSFLERRGRNFFRARLRARITTNPQENPTRARVLEIPRKRTNGNLVRD